MWLASGAEAVAENELEALQVVVRHGGVRENEQGQKSPQLPRSFLSLFLSRSLIPCWLLQLRSLHRCILCTHRLGYADRRRVSHALLRGVGVGGRQILKELHKSCQKDDGTDDQKKGTQLLEVYAIEIQMYTETKNNKKLKVRVGSSSSHSL